MEACKSCDWAEGRDKPLGGIIPLDEFWLLNHYRGPEGFLGWMALTPLKHCMDFSELLNDELSTLGKNIKKVDSALRDYWQTEFNDPIQRVYIVYFFETAFKVPQKEMFHLHIHLIPRPHSFDKLMREFGYKEGEMTSRIHAWGIYKLSQYREIFPAHYTKDGSEGKIRLLKLMDYLSVSIKRK